jgi:hypothetical protein
MVPIPRLVTFIPYELSPPGESREPRRPAPLGARTACE